MLIDFVGFFWCSEENFALGNWILFLFIALRKPVIDEMIYIAWKTID